MNLLKYTMYLLLVGISAVNCFVQLKVSELQLGYRQLSELLSFSEQTENINLNVVAAGVLMNLWKADPTYHVGKVKKALKEVLELTSLFKVDDPKLICDERAFEILKKVDYGTEGVAHSVWPKVRRIDKVIEAFLIKHANKCREFYPEKLKEIKESDPKDKIFVPTMMKILGKIVSLRVKEAAESHAYNEFESLQLKIRFMKMELTAIEMIREEDAETLYRALEQYLPESLRKKLVKNIKSVSRNDFKKVINNELVKPCRIYVDKLGPAVFLPAKFDDVMVKPQDEDEENMQFYHDWAIFNLCTYVIDARNELAIRDRVLEGVKAELSKTETTSL